MTKESRCDGGGAGMTKESRCDGGGVGMTEGRRGAGTTESVGATGCGMGDRGVARLVGWLAALHPPPNLPPGRGEG